MEVDGSYLVARTLKEEGVEHLFFLMGGPNYEIINNSEDFGIKTIDFRHEQAASMAAHGYARVTGRPGVTTAASGPGTLNLLTGQYTAFVDCAPMITLGGAGPISDFGRDGFQEIDQVGMALFTKFALPFELVSILIIIAILGAVVLAKKKL